MNCAEARPLILRGAEGRLELEAQQELAGHLGTCHACWQAFEDQQLVIDALANRPDAAPSLGFPGRVIASLDVTQAWLDAPSWRVWTFRLAPVAAALFVVAAFGLGPSERAEPLEFSDLVAAWVTDTEEDADALPTFTLFWRQDVTDDTLLDAVLTADPDEPLAGS